MQSRVTGRSLALAVWLRSGLWRPWPTPRCKLIAQSPQLVGNSLFSNAIPLCFCGFSPVCGRPSQSECHSSNYICLSVAVSTGERPSLFGVCVSQKCDHPLHNNPTIAPYLYLYVLLGAPGVRIAITPTFYRARCALRINLTAQ